MPTRVTTKLTISLETYNHNYNTFVRLYVQHNHSEAGVYCTLLHMDLPMSGMYNEPRMKHKHETT